MLRRSALAAALLAVIACGGGEKSVDPAVATTIAATSSISLTGVAGSAASPSPSVVVKDQRGDPMSGVTVNFAVTSGGGSVSSASAVTDASGPATVTWTLGTTAGSNQLTASAGTLGTVTFTATSVAGAAASMTKSAGDNQSGTAGAAVAIPPAVTVKDANGNPKSGVAVTFAVATGGGSVTGANATTNASGVATVGSWTLGSAAGINTLTASAAGLPSVTFTASALSAVCAGRTAHSIGTTTSGTLATSDCQLADGTYVDFFSMSVGEANAYRFQQTAAFDTYLYLATGDGAVVAENDDASNTSSNSAIKALLPPGSYLLGASSYDPNVTGDYSVSSSTASTSVSGCELVFVVKNVSTTQNVETTDCLASAPSAPAVYGDAFFIFLRAGQSMTVTMASTQVDSFLEVVRTDGVSLASNDNKDATSKDAQLTFTATQSNYYAILARTAASAQTGSYTLNIQ
ncbi:MAG TPA: Ig-like domain-containing protein [Gemmatimonadaceae bacterium]|nr:Ig-like domain-containing protein [Gemmatimonadaceae bacterium]